MRSVLITPPTPMTVEPLTSSYEGFRLLQVGLWMTHSATLCEAPACTDGSGVPRIVGAVDVQFAHHGQENVRPRVFLALLTLLKVMSEGYRRLLAKATRATDEADSVGILARILADEGGKGYILGVDRRDAESCIEILDHVSRGSYLVSLGLSQLLGPIGAKTQRCRKADILLHLVEVGRNP